MHSTYIKIMPMFYFSLFQTLVSIVLKPHSKSKPLITIHRRLGQTNIIRSVQNASMLLGVYKVNLVLLACLSVCLFVCLFLSSSLNCFQFWVTYLFLGNLRWWHKYNFHTTCQFAGPWEAACLVQP